MFPFASGAYVECSVNPLNFYVGDDGLLWVNWKEGGSGTLQATDTDFKATLATVTVGMISTRPMAVRYSDGTNCAANPAQIIGLWLK